MTHSLIIKDNAGLELFDLLDTTLGINLGSRQISPIKNGRWQEKFELFAKTDNVASDVADAVFLIDGIVKSINDYGNSPAYNSPIWLHEKSEGESSQIRRAPLFMAEQQPIGNGAVGQLQINNAYLGLLTIERGDWENVSLSSIEFDATVDAYFDTEEIPEGGSVDGRLFAINILSTDTGNQIISVGMRPTNFGIANFQPCINWGVSTRTSGSGSTGGTYPVGQSPSITAVYWDGVHFLLPSTLKMTMNDISLSTLDSVNKDYVGEYIQFLRIGISNTTTGANSDAYLKITPFSGYEDDFIYNDPVYMNVLDSAAMYGDSTRGIAIGRLSIPSDVYVDTGTGATTLSEFTIGLDIEIIGIQNAPFAVTLDSTILIPNSNVTLNDTESEDWDTDIDSSVIGDPSGAFALISRLERIHADISVSAKIPNGGGVAAYYSEHFDVSGADPERTITIDYYDRFNSLVEG